MLKIGDFSKLAHVTVKALRLYGEMGLLRPNWVDRFSGYRYYALDQLPRLNRILALKDLGFSLEQIRTQLDENVSAGQLRSMMQVRQADLLEQIRVEQERLGRIEARLKQIETEGKQPVYEVIIKHGLPVPVAALHQRVNSLPQVAAACAEMLVELHVWQQAARLKGELPWIKIIHNPDYVERNIDLEVALLLPTPAPSRVSGRVHLYTLPAVGRMASAVCCMEKDGELSAVYAALYAWVSDNNCRITGSSRELHLTDPASASPFIEVQVPIEPIMTPKQSSEEPMLEPNFVDKPAFLVAGSLYHGKNHNQEIPQLWEKAFLPRMHELKNVCPDVSYGVCSDFEPGTGDFKYMAGVEVSGSQDLPAGMVFWEVPAAHYAVFEHHGSLMGLRDTNEYIYNVWLPKSGFKRSPTPDLEIYQDPDFKGTDDPASVLYLYVPVEK
jgi:predicted transcriptional regulator YdeE/DNA-binding transcriptional MerR regulator